MTKWMHGIMLALSTVVLSIPFGGCTSGRVTARPLVADIGPVVTTKYKYKLKNGPFFNQCKSQYPEVFSENGIPVFLKYNHLSYKRPDFLPGFLSLLISSCSCSIIPAFLVGDSEMSGRYDIRFGDGNASVSSSFVLESDRKEAMSVFLPTALLAYNGKPSENNRHRTFWRHYDYVGTSVEKITHKLTLSNHVSGEAYAYGLAVRLKELEDSGKIPLKGLVPNPQSPSPVAQPLPTPSSASQTYTILSCERESGSDFAYRFVLELTDKSKNSLHTFRTVQQDFRAAVKADYSDSYPNVNKDTLFVEFPEYKLNNGKIEGRAVVLTISVTSLTYDPNTRAGKLAVKVNANQYEEARKWIRKNIETLARDKNIALTTGEIPPAAKFYLGREELKDGNILEIEFKTE